MPLTIPQDIGPPILMKMVQMLVFGSRKMVLTMVVGTMMKIQKTLEFGGMPIILLEVSGFLPKTIL